MRPSAPLRRTVVLVQRLATWLFYTAQTRRMRRRLSAVGLPLNDYVSRAMLDGAKPLARGSAAR